MVALLLFLVPVGCATQHLQTEKALAIVGFKQHRGTPDVANYLKNAQPYVFIPSKDKKLGERFFFVSPARKTVFEGDKTTMQYFQIFQQQEAQRAALDKGQSRTRWAQLGQALALGGAMGAAQAGQNMQQQAAMQQQYALVSQPQQPVVARTTPRSAQRLPAGGVMGRFNPQNPMSEYASPTGRYNRNNPMSEYSSPTGSLNPNNPMSEVSSPMGRYNPNNPMSEVSSPMGRLNPNNPMSEVSSPMGAFNPNNPMGQGVHPVYYQGR